MDNTRLRSLLVIAIMVIASGCGGGGATPTQQPTEAPPTDTPTEVIEETEAAEPTVADGATEVSDEATEESATSEAVPEGTTATISFPNANARSGPGTAYPSLGPIRVGTVLEVIARTDSRDVWYLVTLEDGEPGWLWGRVVTINPADAEVEIAATIPPTPES